MAKLIPIITEKVDMPSSTLRRYRLWPHKRKWCIVDTDNNDAIVKIDKSFDDLHFTCYYMNKAYYYKIQNSVEKN